ncbi:MAG: DUF4340 domain-containing protein [Deltaproteobacteria bacterium]|nr:MAG: DUF4340 domain-containing protein [Deltaproteobacteria bacterium]
MKKRFFITGILVLVLVGLIAGIHLSRKAREEKEKRESEAKKILPIKKDDVKVVILREAGKEATLVKKEGKWYLEEPVSSLADDLRTENILKLADITYVSKVENPENEKEFGFDGNVEEVTFVAGGEKEYTLQAGAERPVGGGCFVRVKGSKEIYAVKEDVKTTITARRMDLFERDVLPLYPNDVKGVSLREGGKRWDLKKKEGSWYLGDKLVGGTEVGDFLREICFLNAVDLYGGKPSKDTGYIEFSLSGGEKGEKIYQVRVYESEKGDVPVQVSHRFEVLKVSRSSAEELRKKYRALVDKLKKVETEKEEKGGTEKKQEKQGEGEKAEKGEKGR